MLYFQCDYIDGAHPDVFRRLAETNADRTVGYGEDPYCQQARELIRAACGAPQADVHFLVGGTQTNLAVIASILRPHQGVICADAGHIACHETGAIEATGHKVLALPSPDGLLSPAQVESFCRAHFENPVREHMVQPGMVYISLPTEGGSLYSKAHLTELSEVCRRWKLPLYLDGARLGYGLSAPANDLTLEDLARLTDLFYIGGTKCGAAFGEALVICKEEWKKDFRYVIKQRGGMLAKGRLLGVQFQALFTDNLYFKICAHAVEQALRIRQALEEKGLPLWGNSPTNQQFVLLTQEQLDQFQRFCCPDVWEWTPEGLAFTRFCTCWATPEEDVDALIARIREMEL